MKQQSFCILIQSAGGTAFGVGVFVAHGCTVNTKALVVVGITFPILLPVVKAFSPFIALACLYLLYLGFCIHRIVCCGFPISACCTVLQYLPNPLCYKLQEVFFGYSGNLKTVLLS